MTGYTQMEGGKGNHTVQMQTWISWTRSASTTPLQRVTAGQVSKSGWETAFNWGSLPEEPPRPLHVTYAAASISCVTAKCSVSIALPMVSKNCIDHLVIVDNRTYNLHCVQGHYSDYNVHKLQKPLLWKRGTRNLLMSKQIAWVSPMMNLSADSASS